MLGVLLRGRSLVRDGRYVIVSGYGILHYSIDMCEFSRLLFWESGRVIPFSLSFVYVCVHIRAAHTTHARHSTDIEERRPFRCCFERLGLLCHGDTKPDPAGIVQASDLRRDQFLNVLSTPCSHPL